MASSSKLNYPQRLFLWLLAYSLLLVGCFVVFQYHREKEFKSAELNARLQGINMKIIAEMEHGDTLASLNSPADMPDLRISIIDANGKVIFDNMLDPNPETNHLDREEVKKALTYGEGYTVRRHSISTGEYYFYSATRSHNGEIIRTAVPYSVSLASLLSTDLNFIRVMGAITLILCILGYIATRRIGQHIQRLNRFAERADRGERIYDTEPFPDDELGSISNHIIRLYASLQQAIADRDSQHRNALFEQQEKERIKKQLTNNINHELKTPVAAIQVCIETLLDHPDMEPTKRTEFLNRCKGATDRLKNLLTDVSTITRIDDAPETIVTEPLDLSLVIRDVITETEPLAEKHQISIENSVTEPVMLKGNASLLASVFRNLIDNAIAYSGGSRLTITPDLLEKKIAITVSDNGCGVAEEHLPHIFERFYRIDKGRSRAAGGTGLGLSIVKNAVLLHGGTITVSNNKQGGLRFIITLPLA